jgi:transposase-like protein
MTTVCTCPACGGKNFDVYGPSSANGSAKCLDCLSSYATVDVEGEAGEAWRQKLLDALAWQETEIARSRASLVPVNPNHVPRKYYSTLCAFGLAKLPGSFF